MDLAQKWRDAEPFDRVLYVAGAVFGILILFMAVTLMMPKKMDVKPVVRQVDPVPDELWQRLAAVEDELRAAKNDMKIISEKIVTMESGVGAAFEQLTSEVNEHRDNIMALGQLQSVPKTVKVVREHKGETNIVE